MSDAKKILKALADAGYDDATAKSVVDLVATQEPDEAKAVLEGLLGASPLIDNFLKRRTSPKNSEKKNNERPKNKSKKPPESLADLKPSGSPSTSESTRGSNNMYRLPFSTPFRAQEIQQNSNEEKSAARKFTNEEKANSIKELDAALKRLDLNSGSSLNSRIKCTCMGSRHGLFEMAPNCLSCGRIVCNKEGLGPCLSCGEPLVETAVLRTIYDILSTQRSTIASTMGKKALAQAGIDPSSKSDEPVFRSAEEAQSTLERLLGYQESDAVRTRIIDQVGDFETPDQGLNMWMTAEEQALQLRKQQRQLRKQEELRKANTGRGRKIISIDIRGNKVYQVEKDAPILDEDLDKAAADEIDELAKIAKESKKVESSPYYDPKKFEGYKRPEYPESHLKENITGRPSSKSRDSEIASLVVAYHEDDAMLY